MNKTIQDALKTWYPKDHKLHLDPLHPAIKLAGEAGELLDLFGKHEYKPGFSWWNCKRCNKSQNRGECPGGCVPLVLDELGDLWYYIRILSYQFELDLQQTHIYASNAMDSELTRLNLVCASFACEIVHTQTANPEQFRIIYTRFMSVLLLLGTSLREVSELNYRKLNSDPTSHGWANAT